jgi:DNA-binding protein HU-beta
MTKTELVAKVAEESKLPKGAAAKVFDAILGCIQDGLKEGEKVHLIGFGTFSVTERKARKGRNPQTGKEIKIPAKKVPKFSAGAALKAAANGKAPAARAPVKRALAKAKPKAKKK